MSGSSFAALLPQRLELILQVPQLTDALSHMADVLVKKLVDLGTVLQGCIAQAQQHADLVERHVELCGRAVAFRACRRGIDWHRARLSTTAKHRLGTPRLTPDLVEVGRTHPDLLRGIAILAAVLASGFVYAMVKAAIYMFMNVLQ